MFRVFSASLHFCHSSDSRFFQRQHLVTGDIVKPRTQRYVSHYVLNHSGQNILSAHPQPTLLTSVLCCDSVSDRRNTAVFVIILKHLPELLYLDTYIYM